MAKTESDNELNNTPVVITRESLLAAIKAKTQANTAPIKISVAGTQLDWRLPSIKSVQEARDNSANEDRSFVLMLIVNYTYLPGTQDKAFTEDDYDGLMELPFDGEWQQNVKLIQDAVNLNVEESAKN